MTYEFNLHIVEIIGIMLAVFFLGAMAGWRFLPPPIDTKKEELINRLFSENMAYQLKSTQGGKNDGTTKGD